MRVDIEFIYVNTFAKAVRIIERLKQNGRRALYTAFTNEDGSHTYLIQYRAREVKA